MDPNANDSGFIGVIGARGLVGEKVLAYGAARRYQLIAFSRARSEEANAQISWHPTSALLESVDFHRFPRAIWLAPLWELPRYVSGLARCGVSRLVALSSTSRYAKLTSTEASERALAQRWADAEEAMISTCEQFSIAWTILRPTLIYGEGRDRNVSDIARIIRRFGLFPVIGAARGLRQPVHADEVALACLQVLETEQARRRDYNVSGGETLSYREMVERIYSSLGKKPRIVSMPPAVFRGVMRIGAKLPRFRHWTPAMADRMNQDLVFDHSAASRDWGYAPGPFRPKFDSRLDQP